MKKPQHNSLDHFITNLQFIWSFPELLCFAKVLSDQHLFCFLNKNIKVAYYSFEGVKQLNFQLYYY